MAKKQIKLNKDQKDIVILMYRSSHSPYLIAKFYGVPQDVVEAALLDGANATAIFWKIQLPMTAPLLLAIFMLRLIMAFKTFDLLYILTFGGPGASTDMAGFAVWRTALRNFDVGTAAAETVLFAAFVSLALLPLLWLHRRVERIAS